MPDDAPPTPKGPPPLPVSAVVPITQKQPAPQQPFAPVPSVATREQVSELAKLVLRKFDEHGQLLQQAISSGADTQPSIDPPQSLPRSVAQHAVTGTQVILIAIGALGVAMQVAAIFKPSLVSPLQHAQEFLRALGGG